MTSHLKRGPGRPKDEALAALRREQILEAATSIFAASSYRNTDLQEIADRVKLSKAALYNYFASKEKLFLAAVDRGLTRLHEHVNASGADEDDPLANFAQRVAAYLAYFRANPDVVELLLQERVEFRDRKQPSYFVH